MRRKDFWPLWYSRRLMQEKMTAMEQSHGTDGLILQGFEDYYKPGGWAWLPGGWVAHLVCMVHHPGVARKAPKAKSLPMPGW